MNELNYTQPTDNNLSGFQRGLSRFSLWSSKHWLALVNLFFLTYVGLPFLAPVLLANGHSRAANVIYQLYNFTCHQFPTRTYFVSGEQVCMCHRCVAMYGTIFLGGLVFGLVRHRLKPLPLRWYLLFLIPIGLDGGLAMAGELTQVIPTFILSGLGLAVLVAIAVVVFKQKERSWPGYLILAIGLLALIYMQFFGPHYSNYYLRTLTGFIFGFGTVWFVYPLMEESFLDVWRDSQLKLAGQVG